MENKEYFTYPIVAHSTKLRERSCVAIYDTERLKLVVPFMSNLSAKLYESAGYSYGFRVKRIISKTAEHSLVYCNTIN